MHQKRHQVLLSLNIFGNLLFFLIHWYLLLVYRHIQHYIIDKSYHTIVIVRLFFHLLSLSSLKCFIKNSLNSFVVTCFIGFPKYSATSFAFLDNNYLLYDVKSLSFPCLPSAFLINCLFVINKTSLIIYFCDSSHNYIIREILYFFKFIYLFTLHTLTFDHCGSSLVQ